MECALNRIIIYIVNHYVESDYACRLFLATIYDIVLLVLHILIGLPGLLSIEDRVFLGLCHLYFLVTHSLPFQVIGCHRNHVPVRLGNKVRIDRHKLLSCLDSIFDRNLSLFLGVRIE